MNFTDAKELRWVKVDQELQELGYNFFLNVDKIRSFLFSMKLGYTRFILEFRKWQGVDDEVGVLALDRSQKSVLISARISQRLLHLTKEEKEEMRLYLNPLPETIALIANDIIRHEISHMEHFYKDGNIFEGKRFWFEYESSISKVTREFIENLRRGKEEPLVKVTNYLIDNNTRLFEFMNKH